MGGFVVGGGVVGGVVVGGVVTGGVVTGGVVTGGWVVPPRASEIWLSRVVLVSRPSREYIIAPARPRCLP